MTIQQFIAWLAVAFFTGALTSGLICLALLEVVKTSAEVDELTNYENPEDQPRTGA